LTRLAIFSSPKPFTNPHIDVIQRNAIQSWKALGAEVEVWLVGEEEGVEKAAKELGVGFIPDVLRNESGTPRIDSIFDCVRQNSRADLMCYVNADILLFPDILAAALKVRDSFDRFLMIGRRWDAPVTELLKIKPGWHEEFLAWAKKAGKFHRAAGSDYFIFPRDTFTNVPAFAVGRAGWDNWMIYHGRCEKMPVIDATETITVVHQNHDFSHFTNGQIHRLQPESQENLRLAGGRFAMFTIYDTDYAMISGRLQKIRLNRWKIVREISIFPAVTLKWKWLARITYFIFNFNLIRKQAKKARQDKKLAEEKAKK
jgi:hypothetical protein